jgi:hypothetical protein
VLYEAVYSPRVQWLLDRLPDDTVAMLEACIHRLEQNPFPAPDELQPLVISAEPIYRNAIACEGWRIAFRVVDDLFVRIDAIGREWPPIDPSLRRPQA